MAKQIKNLLVYYSHDRLLKEYATRYFHGSLIDIGCGTKPYMELLKSFVGEHIGLDYEDSLHSGDKVDLFGTAYAIPVPDASFDSALCTSVLEHLEEPEQGLRECYRVLKPEGIAIYSVPFIWHLHEEPRDYYRFSGYGLNYLFKKVGFEVVEIKPLSGFWVTFGQFLVYNLYRINIGPLRWFRIIDAIGLMMQGVAYVLDHFDRCERWTWGYMVVARKK